MHVSINAPFPFLISVGRNCFRHSVLRSSIRFISSLVHLAGGDGAGGQPTHFTSRTYCVYHISISLFKTNSLVCMWGAIYYANKHIHESSPGCSSRHPLFEFPAAVDPQSLSAIWNYFHQFLLTGNAYPSRKNPVSGKPTTLAFGSVSFIQSAK